MVRGERGEGGSTNRRSLATNDATRGRQGCRRTGPLCTSSCLAKNLYHLAPPDCMLTPTSVEGRGCTYNFTPMAQTEAQQAPEHGDEEKQWDCRRADPLPSSGRFWGKPHHPPSATTVPTSKHTTNTVGASHSQVAGWRVTESSRWQLGRSPKVQFNAEKKSKLFFCSQTYVCLVGARTV